MGSFLPTFWNMTLFFPLSFPFLSITLPPTPPLPSGESLGGGLTCGIVRTTSEFDFCLAFLLFPSLWSPFLHSSKLNQQFRCVPLFTPFGVPLISPNSYLFHLECLSAFSALSPLSFRRSTRLTPFPSFFPLSICLLPVDSSPPLQTPAHFFSASRCLCRSLLKVCPAFSRDRTYRHITHPPSIGLHTTPSLLSFVFFPFDTLFSLSSLTLNPTLSLL